MNKKQKNFLQNQTNTDQCGALLLSFCRAVDRYCDQIGVCNSRSGTARILHDAAFNTVARVCKVSPQYMARMERNIPEMFAGLVALYSTDGFLKTVERTSGMSLDQVAAIIAKHRRQH